MMDDETNNIDFIWHLISQFVSWEFCRTLKERTNDESECSKDLLVFFQDMIIKKTTKVHPADITKHEIAAKFLEEINRADLAHLEPLHDLIEAFKFLCPELELGINKLLYSLQELSQLMNQNVEDISINNEKEKLVSEFSAEILKILPVPELLKVCRQSFNNTSIESKSSLEQDIFKRLQVSNEDEIKKIFKSVSEDNEFLAYMKEATRSSKSSNNQD